MTIGTDAAIEFFGAQVPLDDTTTAVAIDAFSISSDLLVWVNDDDAPQASVVLLADFSIAPNASSSINLYLRPLNIQSTNDQDVPNANFKHVFVGSFPLNDVTTAQYINIQISLPNNQTAQDYEFYVENKSGQILPAGWDIFVTPKTIGPHA